MSVVLDWVHPKRRLVGWTEADVELPKGGTVEAVERELVLLGGSPFHGTTSSSPPEGVICHEWSIDGTTLVYRAELCCAGCDSRALGFYLATVLATSPRSSKDSLLSLQLALYELCINALEHATPVEDEGVRLELTLRIGEDMIEGSLADNCEHFDLLEVERDALEDRVRDRARRGYGITLIQRCLDSLEHEFVESGNVVHFRKRMSPCPQV